MTTYTVLPQDDSQYDVTVTDTATYTVTAQDDSNLDVTITDTDAVTITLQPVTISGSGGVISVNGLTGAPSGAVVLDTDNIDEGTNNLYFTDERVDDRVNVLLQAGNGIRLDYNDEDGELEISSEQLEETVKNVSGGQLLKGTPVYQSGTSGNFMAVAAADASSAAHMPAVGVLKETLADEAEGTMIIAGRIRKVDTSSFGEGDVVYVAPGGGYTNVRPSSENHLVQNLGRVTKVGQNGEGIVYGAGRSNDIPNLATGHVFIGNGSGYETRALTEADISDLTHFSGDYNDLTNTPTIPTNNNQLINGAGYITDYSVTQNDVTQHQAALTITESQISDLTHFSGDYNDLSNTPDLTDITLDENGYFRITSDWDLGSFQMDASGKYRPTNFSNVGLNVFLAHQFLTDNNHNVASLGSQGSTDDGSHNALMVIHGGDNVLRSAENGSMTTTAPLEISSTSLLLNASSDVTIQNNTSVNGKFVLTHNDDTNANHSQFKREVTTLTNGLESSMEFGIQDSTTQSFKMGGRIATQYMDNDEYEFKFQAFDPNDDTTFNNLTVRKNYIYSDNPFQMTSLNDAQAAAWPNMRAGLLIWNPNQSRLQVNNETNWLDIAHLSETKNILLDSDSFLSVTSDFTSGPYNLSVEGKYIPVNLDAISSVYSQTTDMFVAHTWGTANDHAIARFAAINGTDDGNHDSALVLQGQHNRIKSFTGSYGEAKLDIEAQELKVPETLMVVDTPASTGGVLPLKVIRNNTDGGSTVNDDSKVDVAFQIAPGDTDYNGGNVKNIGGFSAVYDTTNGNSFRLYVDPNQEATNPGSNSHEMEVNEDFFKISRPMVFASYVYSGVPNAADHNGHVIRVIDGDAGSPCLAMSDGSNWKVIATLGNNISPT